jgi:lipopolysaccharide/colanic/teichoic acid biosynthesis glycosyltransferase
VIRRALDVVVSAGALVVTAPIVLVAMLVIRLESPGHPIYRQRRVGKDGKEFDMLKLRTMVSGAESMGAGMAVNEGDARITRVGKVLRRWSIDELPNLVNVLRGEMALIGPRPTIQVQVAQYTERQRGRLAIKPGLTGWAQIHGRTSLPWDERIELDLWYVEHRKLKTDLVIVWQTIRMLVNGDGLYKGATGGWKGPAG